MRANGRPTLSVKWFNALKRRVINEASFYLPDKLGFKNIILELVLSRCIGWGPSLASWGMGGEAEGAVSPVGGRGWAYGRVRIQR